MFHFPEYRFNNLCIQLKIHAHYSMWVAPFGDPRVKDLLHLTEAYRSLTRPSSPVRTKAFTMRP